jgi:hypothetical protein
MAKGPARGESLRGTMGMLHGTEKLMTYADGGGVSGGGTMHLDVPINVGGGGMGGGGMGGGGMDGGMGSGYTPMGGGFGGGNNVQQGGTPAAAFGLSGLFGGVPTGSRFGFGIQQNPTGNQPLQGPITNNSRVAPPMLPQQPQNETFYDQSRPTNSFSDANHFAGGGMTGGMSNLGSYSDGGQLLRGPGDGVSDDIPAQIGQHQPARLAEGEFVVPARIVSELGNGSTNAGAKRLYDMLNRIQAGRAQTMGGKNAYANDTNAERHLPA